MIEKTFKYIESLPPKQLQWGLFSIMCFFYFVGFFLKNNHLYLPYEYLVQLGNETKHFLFDQRIINLLEFSYAEFGLKRRILIGTLLSPFPEGIRIYIYGFVSMVSALSLFYFISTMVNKIVNKEVIIFLLLLLSLSPLGLMNMGWLFGALDFFVILIFLISLFFLFKNKLIIVSLLMTIGLLIHASFVFLAWPLVALIIWESSQKNHSYIPRLLVLLKVFIIPVCLAIYLALFGDIDTVKLLHKYDLKDMPMGIENRDMITIRSGKLSFYWISAIFIISLFIMHSTLYRMYSLKRSPYFYVSYSPLLIYLVGEDFFRWLPMLFVLIIATFYIELQKNKLATPSYRVVNKNLVFFISILIAGAFFLGPGHGVFIPLHQFGMLFIKPFL